MGQMADVTVSPSPVQIGIDVVENLLAGYPKRDFQVRLWDGSTWGSNQQSRFTLVLKKPEALREVFLGASELSLAEAYIFDDFDIEGDIEAAFDLADYLLRQDSRPFRHNLYLASLLWRLPAKHRRRAGRQPAILLGELHSKERDRRAISYHYDLPPQFFALWLGWNMVYSSAYFSAGEGMDLDTAQHCKLDYICKKLRLRRGDTRGLVPRVIFRRRIRR